MSLTLSQIAAALDGEISGDQVLAHGPDHSAKDRSMSVRLDPAATDGFLVHSFAGDDPIECKDYVRDRLGLPEWKPTPRDPIERQYVYRLEDGSQYLRVSRTRLKKFWQHRWTGSEWVKGRPKGPKVPYRLPELIAAGDEPIFVCEGEKDADRLASHGLVATSASEGAAAKWTADLNRWFKDRTVYVLADRDKAGEDHAHDVAENLHGIAAEVRIVSLPGLPPKGDVSDWLDAGGDPDKLVELCRAVPIFQPPGGNGVETSVIAEADGDNAQNDQNLTQAATLAKVAEAAELFHSPDGTCFADITAQDNGATSGRPTKEHRETYRIKSRTFDLWLRRRYFEETGGAPGAEAMRSATGLIEARAHFYGPERPVYVRVGGLDGRLYVDLGNDAWEAVEIDANGWRVIGSPPVRFRRAPGVRPLPTPIRGGSVKLLRSFLNVASDGDFVLVVAWVLAALRDRGPYPVLVLAGEQGTAKSFLTELIRALVDPNAAPLRALPREDRDLFIAANNGYVLAFDNVSGMPAWISDTLCRLATGGGFATRQLYTDQDEILFDAMRPTILNGIEDLTTRSDLAERAIVLTLEPIPEEERRPAAAMLAEFELARPAILGALFDVMAHGLQALPATQLAKLPRMADFALWAAACETALWEKGTFESAYAYNRDGMIEAVLGSDPVVGAVRRFIASQKQAWTGTASQLLEKLTQRDAEMGIRRNPKTWPGAAHVLSGRLRRAAPLMRRAGIEIDFHRPNSAGVRLITLGVRESSAVSAVPLLEQKNDQNRGWLP
jgi:hypothetical protein